MAASERTLFMVRQVSDFTTASLACYDDLAAAAFPTGDAGRGCG